MGRAVGCFDPDADERGETSRPKRPVRVSELQEKALRATRHISGTGATTYFSSREHVKRFKALEEKARGADTEGFLFRKWMEYHIEKVAESNKKEMLFSMGNLIKRMENEDRRIDWTAANRKRLLAQRMESAKDLIKAKTVLPGAPARGRHTPVSQWETRLIGCLARGIPRLSTKLPR